MSFFPDDPRQKIRFRRSLVAAFLAVLLSGIVWIASTNAMVRLSPYEVAWALGVLWTGNLVLLGVIRSGLNLHFRDPSLTLPQIIWAASWVLYIIYFVHDVRPALLMLCLLAVNFGAFRLNFAGLAGIAIYVTAGYVVVILLLHLNHPETFRLQIELFLLAGFAAALIGTTLVGQEMHGLRSAIRERNRQLESALEKVNRLAVTDDLTGIHNRRYIEEILDRQVALAHRGDYRFSVCYFDLDHFKNINDTYGHAAGDDVLVRMAQIAAAEIRTADYLARYGGEEFVILFSATDAEHAEAVAERLRKTTENTNFETLPRERVTISCGVTEYRPEETADALMARADKALYAAKEGGRNRVVRA